MVLQAIKYKRGQLEILDQLRLPHEEVYVQIQNPQDGWNAIKSMQVRGAPAIAIVAALSLAVYLAHEDLILQKGTAAIAISQSLKFLVTSRPTAVNLLDAARKLEKLSFAAQMIPGSNNADVTESYIKAAEHMLLDDVRDNESIGNSLATAGYGTALGVIRNLHNRRSLSKVFYTETRPYNQGARLTGFELIHDGIPAELITDSMAAALLQFRGESENIKCIVVGADRVARNGDTANKIGTYSLAILARFHDIKFLVAAPRTTIDLATPDGSSIRIEQRPMEEVTTLKGPRIQRANDGAVTYGNAHEIGIAAAGTRAWNPSFDVTGRELIDGIITEKGVVEKDIDGYFNFDSIFDDTDQDKERGAYGGDSSQLPPDGYSLMSWEKVLNIKADQVKAWTSWLELLEPM